jgi:hypothetical protein
LHDPPCGFFIVHPTFERDERRIRIMAEIEPPNPHELEEIKEKTFTRRAASFVLFLNIMLLMQLT